jgi:iron complex transport system permease protein
MSLPRERLPAPRSWGVRSRAVAYTGVLAVVLAGTALVGARVGYEPIGYGTIARATLNAVSVPVPAPEWGVWHLGPVSLPGPVVEVDWLSPFAFAVSEAHQVIVVRLRLPRIVLGAAVGFALATAGTVMQGFFRNPMADPSIVGVSSGGAVGAVAAIVASVSIPFALPLAAFLGAVGAAALVYAIATEDGRTPVATLLLAGVAMQTFLGAVVAYMLVTSGRSLREAYLWLLGHLQWSTWGKVAVIVPVALLSFAVLYAHARELNLMLLGEEEAAALGVNVERTKRVLLAVASVVTGAAVAVSGVIGFVGLVVPHLARLVVGPDHRVLLPTSALGGAVFLVATDTVARLGALELPVGIVTAFLGAPFFLFLLRHQEVHEL